MEIIETKEYRNGRALVNALLSTGKRKQTRPDREQYPRGKLAQEIASARTVCPFISYNSKKRTYNVAV